jgi:type II secretory ATPase GspE/PulE/Tfp pilus assembly ATPase PilB-like protein
MYVAQRNKVVEEHETVLTSGHIRWWLSQRLAKLGVKIEAERKPPHEMGPPVKLTAMGAANDIENNANLLRARQAAGFLPTREMLYDALARRGDSIMMDFTQQAVAVRYQIDGAWLDAPSRERESGDAVLAVLKQLSGLNPAERRAKQQGDFGVEYETRKLVGTLSSQGTQTGERALIQFHEGAKSKVKTLPELGMRDKMQEQLKALMSAQQGFVLISAPPSSGLTTTCDAAVTYVDRFTRLWVAIEPANHKERAIENVPINTYKPAEGETPTTILPRLIRTYPDCYVIHDLHDADTVSMLANDVMANKRLAVATIKAREAAEAPLRVLAMDVPPATLAQVITGVLCQRLVRVLCDKCKEPFAPPPQVLQQLRLPPGVVQAFYRPPPTPENPRDICPACGGMGYKGRTAVFELLTFDDDLRNVLAETPKLEAIRAAARKAGHRTMQDEGLLLVAKGVTSLDELIRVLKE